MKITNLRLDLHYSDDAIVITIPKGQHKSVLNWIDTVKISKDDEYVIDIKKKPKKRSLNANAYLWELIGKLAEVQNMNRIEVYREFVKDAGVSDSVMVREDALEHFISGWEAKGLGWLCTPMGASWNQPNYECVTVHYGSSSYTSGEMARLINAVVNECKDNNIETLPPDELNRMVEAWRQHG